MAADVNGWLVYWKQPGWRPDLVVAETARAALRIIRDQLRQYDDYAPVRLSRFVEALEPLGDLSTPRLVTLPDA